MKLLTVLLLAFVMALAILVSACGQGPVQLQVPVEVKPAPTSTPTSNPKSVSDFVSKGDKTLTQFKDALDLANRTPRMALAAQIASLQKIHQEYDDIDAPDCAKKYQQWVSSAMNNYIQGFLNFLGQGSDSTTQTYFKAADTNLKEADAELVNVHLIASGLPTPTPTLVPTPTPTPDPHVVMCNGLMQAYMNFSGDELNQKAVYNQMVVMKCPTPSASPIPAATATVPTPMVSPVAECPTIPNGSGGVLITNKLNIRVTYVMGDKSGEVAPYDQTFITLQPGDYTYQITAQFTTQNGTLRLVSGGCQVVTVSK